MKIILFKIKMNYKITFKIVNTNWKTGLRYMLTFDNFVNKIELL